MARTKKAAVEGQAEARALVDLPEFEVRCGEAFAADAAVIESLVAGGMADASPEAIAYAKEPDAAPE
jgi:hypothetical protein